MENKEKSAWWPQIINQAMTLARNVAREWPAEHPVVWSPSSSDGKDWQAPAHSRTQALHYKIAFPKFTHWNTVFISWICQLKCLRLLESCLWPTTWWEECLQFFWHVELKQLSHFPLHLTVTPGCILSEHHFLISPLSQCISAGGG